VLPLGAPGVRFGSHLLAQDREPGGKCRQPHALFLLLQARGVGVEFDEHVTSLHLPAHRQVRGHHAARQWRRQRVHRPVYFQPRLLAHLVDGHTGQAHPGPPAAQEHHGGQPCQQRAAEPLPVQGA
jgi:hypothetical protein